MGSDTTTNAFGPNARHNKFMIEKSISTSKNQSYSEKKRGRPIRSETAPSAMGIDPILPPLNKFVRRLLALSSIFLLDFFLSVNTCSNSSVAATGDEII
ncbi:hypothetical protein CR513_49115, partial [Mucuna pruriens]